MEEYILSNIDEDCFLLYINSPCIIVGRFQNTLAEINHDWVVEHNIPVVRRLTGGGTVFHDLGNLNFSFIMKGMAESSEGFARYTARCWMCSTTWEFPPSCRDVTISPSMD
jgi:lipoate-protein ligase A